MKYKGYELRKEPFPTPVNPNYEGWSIYDGETRRKANIGSVELCKWYINKMIENGRWMPGKE